MHLVARVGRILSSPGTEWPVIAGEAASIKSLYLGYAAILALIPAIGGFIGQTITGFEYDGFTIRTSPSTGLIWAVVSYVYGLAMLIVMAKIIQLIIPKSGNATDVVGPLKLVVYASPRSGSAASFWSCPPSGG